MLRALGPPSGAFGRLDAAPWAVYVIGFPHRSSTRRSPLRDGFTPTEVEAAKAGWLQNREVGRSRDQSLVGTLANYLFVGRTMAFDADLERKVSALTPEQINAAMRRYINPAKLTMVEAGDFNRPAPAAPTPAPSAAPLRP